MPKKTKNQDLLTWAMEGAKDRLTALAQEVEKIYSTFPSLRSGTAVRSSRDHRKTGTTAIPQKRRRMSAAGRAKLRASAKRRWAEAKKKGKKRLG